MHKRLTDRSLKSLKPASPGSRYDVMDADVRGFGVRVSDKGKRTFILVGRYPGAGKGHPTRRAIGEYPSLSLEDARKKARLWRQIIKDGRDPALVEKEEAEQRRLGDLKKQKNTFGSVADDFIKLRVKGQRTAADTQRTIRRELIARWGHRPVTEITKADVIAAVEEIAERAPYMARNALGHIRTIFGWAIARDIYGLEASPTDRLKPAVLIGKKESRQRTLDDHELAALWHATAKMGYPFGDLYRLLLLTGARRDEWAGATWGEVDLDRRLLTIPPERFKSNATHLIPLSGAVCEILKALPRFQGDYIFSCTFGARPVGNFAKAKERLDRLMAEELDKTPPPFVIYDLRRTMRTKLASLRVSDLVAEMVIGHGRKGIQRVYNQHSYEPEMREALELWAARLRSIVEPPPENVVELKARA
jgi:integrase